MSDYIPTDYVNGGEPAINETNLNHTEVGIEDAHNEIEDIALGNTTVALAETCDISTFIRPASQVLLGGVKVHIVTDSSTGEITGFMDSATALDLPNAVNDLEVTDTLPGIIRATFSESSNALWYDLYRDGVTLATDIESGFKYLTTEGTWDFYIVAHNAFGSTQGNTTEGSARAIPTAPPIAITDFSASDDKVQSVDFNWTDHYDSYRFDLYSGNILIQEDVLPGVTVIIPEGTASYYVKAINHLGTTDSNTDDGVSTTLIPSQIVDLVATTTETAKIIFTFSPVSQPALYDLYRDGVLHRNSVYSGYEMASPGGSWQFTVKAHNTVGGTDSNEVTGTAVAANFPPEQIVDFSATDDERLQITMNFSEALDAEQYDLYQNGILHRTDIYPGYILDSVDGTWTYYVEASNTVGIANSNEDSGTSVEAFTVVPDPVTDLVVSTTLVNAILITFTELPNTTRYDLYRDGTPYKSDVNDGDTFQTFHGTWDFYIVSSNPIGSTVGNEVIGEAEPANSAPGPIASFTATDGEVNLITMTWGDSVGAARYDLYKNGRRIREAVQSPYALQSVEGEWSFYVKAVNLLGSTDSPTDIGSAIPSEYPPEAIVDFAASDDLRGIIMMTFSPALHAVSYDLYESSILVVSNIVSGYEFITGDARTADYFVVAVNGRGEVPSNEDSGTSLAHLTPPDLITDFVATEGQLNQVTVTFSLATHATSYDLYRNDALAQADISSGYVYSIAGPDTSSYFVRAINDEHYTDSEPDSGSSVAFVPGEVTIDYNSYTFIGGGEGTVEILNGVGTFTPPPGTTEVNVCVLGGGGSGTSWEHVQGNCAGGSAGVLVSGTEAVIGGTPVPIVIGNGGASVSGDNNTGNAGASSSFELLIGTGGPGGTPEGAYEGNGAGSVSPCDGNTYTDGLLHIESGGFGWGGQASAFGNGGNGNRHAPAGAGIAGSGGGGVYYSDGGGEPSGPGGNGRIHISWG